jgi:hypothetical protein
VWVLVAAILSCGLAAALLVVGITGYFHLGREARTLRDTVMSTTTNAGAWNKRVELNVGALTCGFARTVVSFFHLKPEVRAALQAVRAAEVGVYHLTQRVPLTGGAEVLAAADKGMTARGWERLVGVAQHGALVAVYVPRNSASTANVKLCVLTLTPNDMVVVSARGNLEPVEKLVAQHLRPLLESLN